MRFGLDLGTKNIVLSYEDPETGKTRYRREVNGFYKLPNDNAFAENMLIQAGVPFIKQDDGTFVALGGKAEEIAHAFNKTLKRPMKDGVLCQGEEDAIEIMAVIVQNLIGHSLDEDSILYYCTPAPAINADVNTDFHRKIAQMIVNGYESTTGSTIEGNNINEAQALVLSGIESKTGIGISWGAGMVNVCYCLYGLPVYSFSVVGSGDWIDTESAKQYGFKPEKPEGDYKQTPTSISRMKESMSLAGMPTDKTERTIYINYTILMDNVIDGIIKGFKENEDKARISMPMPVVVAGGTSSPEGFTELFKEQFMAKKPPFEVGEIIRPKKPLYAVAEGCLLAAKLHGDKE
jgi:hypothetical protein